MRGSNDVVDQVDDMASGIGRESMTISPRVFYEKCGVDHRILRRTSAFYRYGLGRISRSTPRTVASLADVEAVGDLDDHDDDDNDRSIIGMGMGFIASALRFIYRPKTRE